MYSDYEGLVFSEFLVFTEVEKKLLQASWGVIFNYCTDLISTLK